MKRIIILIAVCGLFFSACKNNAGNIQPYSILPEPQQIEYVKGSFKMKDNLTIAFPQELASEAELMRQFLATGSVKSVLQEGKKKADIVLSIDKRVLPEQPEGYVLDIKPKKISIKANTPAGIFYGMQTLRQLIAYPIHTNALQTGVITDYPALGWRAFMLDEARNFKGKEVVFKLLDNLSQLKMNVFHWHLTDDQGWRIEIKKYPELTKTGAFRKSTLYCDRWVHDNKPHGGFYTQEEIREVIAYAAARHITIVPEIEMPGHSAAAIASYPWLGSTGKKIEVPCGWGWDGIVEAFNVTDPKVMGFLKEVLEEVIALFPGKVIHIGGDEVHYKFWTDSPAITKYMSEKGFKTPAGLQIDFTNHISQWLTSKNRRMMGWNDITGSSLDEKAEKPTAEVRLASNTIIHFFTGDTSIVRQAIHDGYHIVNSNYVYTYLDLRDDRFIPIEKAYSFRPVPEGLTPAQQKQVLGLGCQMWSECVPDEVTLNRKVYPRIAAYAECGWTNPGKKDYDRFLRALDYFKASWEKQGIKN
jgi:hexosaminidase